MYWAYISASSWLGRSNPLPRPPSVMPWIVERGQGEVELGLQKRLAPVGGRYCSDKKNSIIKFLDK